MVNEQFYYYPENIINAQPFTLTMSGIVACDGTYRFERNSYPYYIFEYILAGKGTLEVNAISYKPEKDDIYIIKQGSKHKYYSDTIDPWKKIWFTATGPLVDHLLQVYKLDNIGCIKGYGLLHYFYDLQNLLKNQDHNLQLNSTVLFHAFLFELNASITSFKQSYSKTALTLKDFLDNNIKNQVTVQDLCNLVYKSPSQVIRIFKKDFGMTPYEYLILNRISTAKLMLQNLEIPVKEIANQLQFADVHYFSNVFKARTGISPTEFRKASY